MGELGVQSPQYHRELGEFVRRCGIENFFSIGNRMLDAVEGYGEGARHFETQEELLAALKDEMAKGPHAVLFKASNFMKLFKLADELVRTWNKQEEKESKEN